jgi:NAD(P)-dependent dehydrogenase (short-subunit alcohol dehydrogenase family)
VIEGWSVKAPKDVQAVMETITPTRRMGRPDEIGQIAARLLVEAAAYLAGAQSQWTAP